MLRSRRLSPWLLFAVASMVASPALADEAAPSVASDGLPTVGYTKGFFIHNWNRTRTLHLSLVGQMLYSTLLDGSDVEEQSLSVRHVRPKLTGLLGSPALRYAVLAEVGETTRLLDAYVDWAAVPGWLHVRAGRTKRPFSRQFLVPIGKLAFVDRSVTDDAFGTGRDVGISVHDDFFGATRLAWILGVFNGSGVTDGEAVTTFEPMLVGRIEYRYGDIEPYDEAQFDGPSGSPSDSSIDGAGGSSGFAVGLAGRSELDVDGDDDARTSATLDYVAHFWHVRASGAAFAQWYQRGPGPYDFNFAEDRVAGWHQQLTWTWDDLIQPAVRWAQIYGPGTNDDRQEATASLSLYFQGHGLKWQTDVTGFTTQRPGDDDVKLRIRSQLQFAF